MVIIWGGILTGTAGCRIFCGAPEELIAVLVVVIPTAILLLFVISALMVIGGIGLLQHKPWARILVLILACVELIDFPIGTAVGIYSLWVLIQDETVKLFQPDTVTEED